MIVNLHIPRPVNLLIRLNNIGILRALLVWLDYVFCMVHSLSSGKGKMFLCAACHAFTPHVNAWKNLIGIVVQIQARKYVWK